MINIEAHITLGAVFRAIDTAVYELYNLNEDEIKVVEGKK